MISSAIAIFHSRIPSFTSKISELIFYSHVLQNSPPFAPTKFADNGGDNYHLHHCYYLHLIWTRALISFLCFIYQLHSDSTSVEVVSHTPLRSQVPFTGPSSRLVEFTNKIMLGLVYQLCRKSWNFLGGHGILPCQWLTGEGT